MGRSWREGVGEGLILVIRIFLVQQKTSIIRRAAPWIICFPFSSSDLGGRG